MMKTIVIFVLCLSATFALPKQVLRPVHPVFAPAPKIVGGSEVTPHSVPYQLGLFLAGGYFCGASLISTTYVMTAAHCGELDNTPTVVLGAHEINNNNEEGQKRIVAIKTKVHEQWDSDTLLNDIALIQVPTVTLNTNIKSVPLAPASAGDLTGATATATGWGKASDSATSIAPKLRTVTSKILSNPACTAGYLNLIEVADSNICLDGSGGKSTCNGDSGGPLTAVVSGKTVQIGLTSFGISLGCEVGFPAAFTRITSFLTWIEKNSGVKPM